MMTQGFFLQLLDATSAFDFSWTHGPYGDHCVVGDCADDLDALDPDARNRATDYIRAVREAQITASDAMAFARDCYRDNNLCGALSALREAEAAERQFGDSTTYRPMVAYLDGVSS